MHAVNMKSTKRVQPGWRQRKWFLTVVIVLVTHYASCTFIPKTAEKCMRSGGCEGGKVTGRVMMRCSCVSALSLSHSLYVYV